MARIPISILMTIPVYEEFLFCGLFSQLRGTSLLSFHVPTDYDEKRLSKWFQKRKVWFREG